MAPRTEAGRRTLHFTDASGTTGIDRFGSTPTWGAAWADYDLDGAVDLMLNRHKRRPALFRGPAPFEIAEADFQPTGGRRYYDRHLCVWGEANRDGAPDLYCVSGAQGGSGTGPNQLLLQQDSVFSRAENLLGVVDPLGRGRSANWLDYDGDADLDLFVANEERAGQPNVFYRNDRTRFTRVAVGVEEVMASTASSWADWDRDGDPDLVVLGHGFVGSRAYENADGRFREKRVAAITETTWHGAAWSDFDADGWPDVALIDEGRVLVLQNQAGALVPYFEEPVRGGRAAVWIDVENDGDRDLFVVRGEGGEGDEPGEGNSGDFFFLNEGATFEKKAVPGARGPSSGDGESAAVADFDRDGLADLLVTNGYFRTPGQIQLLRNESTPAGLSIGISLRGPPGNPFGYGAWIEVRVSGRKLWTPVTDGVSFRSQSEPAHVVVGIGDAQEARVLVHWPDGSVTCVAGPAGSAIRADVADAVASPDEPSCSSS